MATDAGEIQVKLTLKADEFKKIMDQSEKNVQSFGQKAKSFISSSAVAISGALIGLAKFSKDAVAAYGEQEQATVALNQALANQGKFTQDVSDDLHAYASELQRTTTFADEAIVSTEAQLVAFGLEGQQLKEVTRATLDLATAKGVDLKSAAQLLGKAFVGETGALSRYGIVIDENIPKSEKFAAVMDQVTGTFGGQAQAKAKTFSGQITQMGNAFNDLQEEIGHIISGEGVGLVQMLTNMIQRVADGIATIRGFASEFRSFADFLKVNFITVLGAIAIGVLDLLSKIPFVSQLIRLLGGDIEKTKQIVEEQVVAIQANINMSEFATSKMATDEQKKRFEVQATTNLIKQEAEVRRVTDEEMRAAMMEGFMKNEDEKEKKQREFAQNFITTQEDMKKIALNVANNIFSNFGNGVADMILESRKFSDVIKQIWKDIARAVIAEISKMIAKWLAFQALKAAGTGGFGGFFAEGGIISEPSVITGLRSGVTHIAGEAGPEAVVPLGQMNRPGLPKNATMDEAGAGGSGGSINLTVNIEGQFIEGNETTWQRLFKDKILPEIKRVTMTNPTGNFIRRRGATA